jgi:hypothetical protein
MVAVLEVTSFDERDADRIANPLISPSHSHARYLHSLWIKHCKSLSFSLGLSKSLTMTMTRQAELD